MGEGEGGTVAVLVSLVTVRDTVKPARIKTKGKRKSVSTLVELYDNDGSSGSGCVLMSKRIKYTPLQFGPKI